MKSTIRSREGRSGFGARRNCIVIPVVRHSDLGSCQPAARARGPCSRCHHLGIRRYSCIYSHRLFPRARLTHTAEKTSSHALEADALHFSSDLWSSFAVLIGLVGVHFGLRWADSVAALVGRCLGLCRRLAPGQTHDRHTHGCLLPRARLRRSQPLQGVFRAWSGLSRCARACRPTDFHRSSTGGQSYAATRSRERAKGRGGSRAASADSWRGTRGYDGPSSAQ